MRLSTTAIDAEIQNTIANNLKDRVLWDESVRGFGIRIRKGGGAYFVAVYRFQGQLRKLTIGRYGRITLSQARDEAKARFGEVSRGVDPAERRQRERAGSFVKDLCAKYVNEHAPKKRTGRTDRERIAREILPYFGTRKIASITYFDVVEFHKSIEAPIEANRCLSLLSKMFTLAREWRMVEPNFQNPTQGVAKNPEKSRNRFVREDEMPRLLRAIQNLEDPHMRGAFLTLLFTGLREISVIRLKWTDLDLKAGLLFERESKTAMADEIITHALSKAAVNALSEIPRIEGDDNIFLCGKALRRRIDELRKCWGEVKKVAEINEAEGKLWIHDLRRTVGSWLVSNNYSTRITKEALKHKSDSAAQRYQRISNENIVRAAMDDITSKMLDTAKVVETSTT